MNRIALIGAPLLLFLSAPLGGQAQDKIFDNINPGACSYTDTATLDLNRPAHLDRIALWYNWAGGETALPYTMSTGGRSIRTGTMTRGGCDPYQGSWCLAVDRLNMDVAAGSYTVRAAKTRVCQNSGSGGRGFIQAFGQYTSAKPAPTPPPPPPPTTTTQPADPCAGKPRSNNPYDECNTVTVIKSVPTGNGAAINPLADRLLSVGRPSVMSPNGAPAQGGNDGAKNGGYGFKTAFDTHPWWQIDLQTECLISEVRIFNSSNYQPGDAKYLEVRFSSDGNSWVTRYKHDGSIPAYPLALKFANQSARYVAIVLADSNVSLHLDEVEVYGHGASGPQPALK